MAGSQLMEKKLESLFMTSTPAFSEHWGKERVRVGRSWTQPELRLKSNEDLHKLWYILLKERNMLLTMEEAYKVEALEMPNPERLDKVDESMENVEYVVRERNRAYFELETGVSGEAERRIQTGPFGLPVGYTPKEHAVPWKLNAEYRKFLRYRYQVWSLTQFYSVAFSNSRIGVKMCVFNKRTIKVCVSCC